MPTAAVTSALAEARAQVWAAQAVVAHAGAVTWTGPAADAADARRTALLADLRRCLDALDVLDALDRAAGRAAKVCHAPAPLVPPREVPAWA